MAGPLHVIEETDDFLVTCGASESFTAHGLRTRVGLAIWQGAAPDKKWETLGTAQGSLPLEISSATAHERIGG